MATGKPLLKNKDKPRKLKKKSVSKLKKEADRIFSIYIRKKYANKNGEVKCYTCPKVLPWKEIQNGHFVSRSNLATRFDEDNCRPQCVGCNVFGSGRIATYAFLLDKELGEGTVARLYKKAQEIIPNFNYEAVIEKFKETKED